MLSSSLPPLRPSFCLLPISLGGFLLSCLDCLKWGIYTPGFYLLGFFTGYLLRDRLRHDFP